MPIATYGSQSASSVNLVATSAGSSEKAIVRRNVPDIAKCRDAIDNEPALLRHMLLVLRKSPGLAAQRKIGDVEARLAELRAAHAKILAAEQVCRFCGWRWFLREGTTAIRCPGCKLRSEERRVGKECRL